MTDPMQDAPRDPPSPASILDLFLRPTRFFRTTDLGYGRVWLVLAWVAGISAAIDQIDKNLFRAALGEPRPGWYLWGQPVVESWIKFWPWILVAGVMAAALVWYIGGWWFNLRIRWSGDRLANRREGRLVYTFAGAVQSVPAVLYAVAATVLYESYYDAVMADEIWSSVLLIFPLWSVGTSYRGVRSRFDVRPWPARFWFVILPILALVVLLGLVGIAISMLARASGTVA